MRNANSPNFPFKISHSYSSNNYCPHTNRKKPNELRTHLLNSFTNENMDMFRLDCNKELNRGGYHNKYYDNMINIDRSEGFKQYEKNKNKIHLIDTLKSNYSMSQNQNYLKKIISNEEAQLISQKNLHQNKQKHLNNSCLPLTFEETKMLQENYNINNKIPYKLSRSVNSKELLNKDVASSYQSKMSPLYLINMNDYQISEGDKENPQREFVFQMKDYKVKDPIKDKVMIIHNKNKVAVNKWSPFYENYMKIKDKGFYREGGLFSEYVRTHRKEFDEMQKDVDDKREKILIEKGYNNYNREDNVKRLKKRRLPPLDNKRRCKSMEEYYY